MTVPQQRPVTRKQIQASNAHIDPAEPNCPRTAVFVGGTAGLGEAALHDLALRLGAAREHNRDVRRPARIYVVGRHASAARVKESLAKIKARIRAGNPDDDGGVELIWTPGEVSLLAEVKRICAELKEKETSLDLLFLSTGYAPFGGREETKEGLDTAHVLGYYAKILFVQHLLPLLRNAPAARVVAILAAGRESASFGFDVNDLNLENLDKPTNRWWFLPFGARCQVHNVTMFTMAMEQIADDEANTGITFIHASPGLVNTGNLNRGWQGRWFLQILANIVLAPVFLLAGFSLQESRERMMYLMTSAKYGGRGVPLSTTPGVVPGVTTRSQETGGLFLVHQLCGSLTDDRVLVELRKHAKEKIWEKTEEVLRPYV
ncbi:hypothetical protein B0H66DRAFT_395933 [Apodospora peruviana]|uniref:Uncharacterized protein n=1 Tax=Apodospora peruviana TaxID=516989 RepID=A0AAE0LYA7_9PEZI|nr:hypothetical protein B0H66DRAFT_395933 [Apodospora peruviana]